MNGPGPPPLVVPVFVAVPGRARLRVAGLRGRPGLAYHLQDQLSGRDAILRISANPRTGTILVLFDPRRLRLRDLVSAVVQIRARAPRKPAAAGRPAGRPSSAERAAWHHLPREGIVGKLRAAPEAGLSTGEASERLALIGPNRLPSPPSKSGMTIVLEQVGSLPMLLLGAAALVSAVSVGLLDAGVIVAVIGINAAIGYVTESRVARILASLDSLAEPMAFVRRDGREAVVPAADLVPGDLMLLKPGHEVPADGRLLGASGLAANEGFLTGESAPVSKDPAALHRPDTPIGDRTNMVYSGTVVTEGVGVAVVTETGSRTELGHVRALAGEAVAPPTPLERQLEETGRKLALISIGVCGGMFVLGVLRGLPALAMFRTAAALAVAAVPEGLPTVATTTLALGVRRMLQHRALVRRLAAVESLGATTVICVDKTGTITENRMKVGVWHIGGADVLPGARLSAVGADSSASNGLQDDAGVTPLPPPADVERALTIAVLCNEADFTRDGQGRPRAGGSETEAALLLAAHEGGIDTAELRRRFPVAAVHPRADGRNWMTTVHATGDRHLIMVKGAPEEVLDRSSRWLDQGEERPLGAETRRAILRANARMADQAMRVLGLAMRESSEGLEMSAGTEPPDDDLVWVGLVGLIDPVRDGVREAIAVCHGAGIRTVVITGDQSRTAVAVSRGIGLVPDDRVRVLETSRLAQMSEEVLRGVVREVDVFARVAPAHKYEIVRALQATGEVVAMTGDGINDAPALKAADVGVAMGGRGAAMARDLADVVLMDDDFASIAAAVEQGRTIQANIRKALRFLLATNLSEIILTVGALMLGMAQPLSAFHLLWINLITDVLPALGLAVEPAEPGVMREPPADPREPILSRDALGSIVRDAALMGLGTLGAYAMALGRYGPGPRASTVAFSTITMAQLAYALGCRSEERSALEGLGRSKTLLGTIGGTAGLQAGTVIVPALRALLGTTPLAFSDLALVAAGAGVPVAACEVLKTRRPAPGRGGGHEGHG